MYMKQRSYHRVLQLHLKRAKKGGASLDCHSNRRALLYVSSHCIVPSDVPSRRNEGFRITVDVVSDVDIDGHARSKTQAVDNLWESRGVRWIRVVHIE